MNTPRTDVNRLMSMVAGLLMCTGTPTVAQAPSRPPQSQPGTVTLSLSEYDRLVARAERPVPPPNLPPLAATVTRAVAHVRVTGQRVAGTYTVDGEVFATGISKVPLVSGNPVADARVGGAQIPLVREGDVTLALLEGPRPFSATLEWGVPISHARGRSVFAAPAPLAGAASAIFELPPGASDIDVQSAVVTRTVASATTTRVEATLIPRNTPLVSWTSRRVESEATRAVRTAAAVRSLITLRDGEVRITSLVELTVLSGQPDRVEIGVPTGFVFSGGGDTATTDGDTRGAVVTVRIERPQERRHQFMVNFERQGAATGRLDVAMPTVTGAERETGEVAIEAAGAVELRVTESDLVGRIDVREASPELASLAGQAVLAALRYQRRVQAPAVVALDVTRFPDAPLITAVADRAVATTLVTVDGRTLTEIALTLRNRAQPYLRVELPAGATMISAEVAGETAKLAHAPDGARVPLLRPGFRPDGPYPVSFVYVHAGQPLTKKGRAAVLLPKMDVPIGVVEWEVFVPDRYRVRNFDGDALLEPPVATASAPETNKLHAASGSGSGRGGGQGGGIAGGVAEYRPAPGQLVGMLTDNSGAVLPGATITAHYDGEVTGQTVVNEAGWFHLPGIRSGRLTIVAELAGFKRLEKRVRVDAAKPTRVDLKLELGALVEQVSVRAEGDVEREARDEAAQAAPSQNVFSLQRRVEGVLPVRIDVPRAGASYRFVRPLVLDEVTTVAFDYRSR